MALPSGYTQLEYIQSSGTQWVDTGFAPNKDTRVVIDYQVLDSHSGEGHICSVRDTTGGPYLIMLCNTSLANNYQARVGTGNLATLSTLGTSRERMVWDFNKNVLTVNGTVLNTWASQTYTMTNTLPIFCRKTGSTAGDFIRARVYSCQIFDNGTLIRDLRPVQRVSDKSIGLYDLVNGLFYTNKGSGAFEAGFSFTSGYTPLEYIQSSGTQYINTLINPGNNTKVVVDVEAVNVQSGTYYAFFGAEDGTRMFDVQKASSNVWTLYYRYNTSYSSTWSQTAATFVNRRTILVDGGSATIDGVTKAYSNGNFSIDYPLYLFGINTKGTAGSLTPMKLYSCQIYQGGALVRDFVPVQRNSDGALGLFDKVNSVFYPNAGSGVFTAGPELVVAVHKTLVNDTLYDITMCRALVGDTVYGSITGKTLAGDTIYEIPFEIGDTAPSNPAEPEEITFTIIKVGTTMPIENQWECTAADSMTWSEWCASEYDTVGLSVSGSYVAQDNATLVRLHDSNSYSAQTDPSDTIISGYTYYLLCI